MAMRRIAPDSLLELALATLRDEVIPALPADKRYAASMIANALEISRREVASDVDQPMWKLLDEYYDDGDGTPKKLATDIRSGIVGEATRPGVGQHLLAVLESELAITNPKFLKGRE